VISTHPKHPETLLSDLASQDRLENVSDQKKEGRNAKYSENNLSIDSTSMPL
jgi:hypothetical protein